MWGFMIKEFDELRKNPHPGLAILVGIPFFLLGVICVCWWYNIRSYDQLNAAKFKVVGMLEQRLPEQPYAVEWEMLGRGVNPNLYQPISKLETWVPVVMGIADLLTMLIVVLMLTAKSY